MISASVGVKESIEHYLTDGRARENPHALLAEVRSIAPIYKAGTGQWVVTGHRESAILLRDPRLSRWEAARQELYADDQDSPEERELLENDAELRHAIDSVGLMMILRDEPDHSRLRGLIRHVFLPSSIEGWRRRAEEVTKSVVDSVMDRETFDFKSELAYRVPEIIICEMTGVPHADHALWSQWSRDSVASMRVPKPRGETLRKAQEARRSFYLYFKDLIARRRGNLGNDLVSILLRAEEEGDKLSEDEVIATMAMLITAGHETTGNLATNGMLLLLDNPDRYKELHENPQLIPSAVNEFLRLDGPSAIAAPRVALEDFAFEGVTFRKGDPVVFLRIAANRDPSVFPNPNAIDFHRPNLALHQAFGLGIHVCLGRQLALLELEIIFAEVVRRLPNLELVERPRYALTAPRGLESLKVRRK